MIFIDKNTSRKEIARAVKALRSWVSVSLDIETSGNIKDIYSHEVVMLQLGRADEQIVIDAREVDIVPYLNLIADKIIIGHNLKFDLSVLRIKYNFYAKYIYDTMLAAYVYECGRFAKKYTLEEVSRRYVDDNAYSAQLNLFIPPVTKEVRKTFHNYSGPFTELQTMYGALDTYYAYALYTKLSDLLYEEDLSRTLKEEMDFMPVVMEMELNGIPIDSEQWAKLAQQNTDKAEMLLAKLKKVADINWNSSKQVIKVFKEHGINTKVIDKETYTIKDSVNVDVLRKQKAQFAVLSLYLDYKQTVKLSSTYGLKFLSNINPTTGRIHTSIRQMVETGRTSSMGPNMQNIPHSKEFRSCFKAPDGKVFVIADFMNQELRILADKAKEPTMLEAFRHNRDIHLETAKVLFNDPQMDKEDERRRIAKNVNFLCAFGGGMMTLSTKYGVEKEMARYIIKLYYEQFSALKEYFDKVGASAKEKGYIVIDDVIGRKSYLENYHEFRAYDTYMRSSKLLGVRPLHKLEDKFSEISAKIQRDAQNRPIQGTGANISKRAGILLYNHPRKHLYKIILLIHDEWLLECSESDAEEVKQILEECMLEASKVYCKNITIPGEGKISKTWVKN